jgi:hypothetical protein
MPMAIGYGQSKAGNFEVDDDIMELVYEKETNGLEELDLSIYCLK